MEIQLAVFDLDGVVVNTDEFHFLAWEQVLLDKWGIRHTRQAEELTKGIPRYTCMELLAEHYHIDASPEELRRVADEKNLAYQNLLRTRLSDKQILSGIPETLRLLREHGIPTALASSSHNAPFIVEKLGLKFDFCVDPDSVAHGKPAPDIYLAAARRFGLPPEACVGVEDAASGMAAIRGAGMFCVGIGVPAMGGGADAAVSSTDQLPGVFGALLGLPPALNWAAGFSTALAAPAVPTVGTTVRRLSHMAGFFGDQPAVRALLERGEDPVIYEFHELAAPEHPGDLSFGITTLYPGGIGGECYMTKGHFHRELDTGEVYYTLRGSGMMMTENMDGVVRWFPLSPGSAVYAAKGFAHRMVNTGDEPLVCFFAYRADAGHDYRTIGISGFRRRVFRRGGKIEIEAAHTHTKEEPQ